MKKIILFSAVITAFLFSAQADAQTLTRGKVMDSLNIKPLAYFYVVENKGVTYWGCNSMMRHYNGEIWLNELEIEGVQITGIKIRPEQNLQLNLKLTTLVRFKKMSPKGAFNHIYSTFEKYKFDPNWVQKI